MAVVFSTDVPLPAADGFGVPGLLDRVQDLLVAMGYLHNPKIVEEQIVDLFPLFKWSS